MKVMSYQRPIRVFTDIKNAPAEHFQLKEVYNNPSKFQTETEGTMNINLEAKDRHINVTGVGDITLQPDRFSITIKYKAVKDTLQDAKNSVTRRLDYIVQTLKNATLKDDEYQIYQHTNHADSMVNIDCEVEAHFTDFNKCQNVSNLLAEKLGPAITVSLPRCYHAKGSMDKVRKQAGMLAIHNARQKAGEMARVIHLTVGHAVKIEEKGSIETYGGGEKEEDFDLNPGIQQRMVDATVLVSSRVDVCFELKSSKSKKRQNLPA